jgi:L-fuculose-phosphate aldolase
VKNDLKSIDISGRKLVAMRDVQDAAAAGANQVLIGDNSIVTPSARDFLAQNNIAIVPNGKGSGSSSAPKPASAAPASGQIEAYRNAVINRPAPNPRLFNTPEAEAVKQEICAVGRKLWMRQFVDGNGGNISYRIGPNEIICTPTLVSKFDLKPEELCMVDLDGKQIAGTKPRTSEILLHLEIYKAVPEAKSAVHCHPPHATAYAITGRVPPNLVIPEFEVFVGKVAISPYKTPGTIEFAQTVIPFVKEHNTVLLANHGIICWADTVTHAEWYAEVLETYCWTLMLANQLGTPISHITEQQGADLLAIKKTLGLPDIRFDTSKMKECQLSDLDEQGSIALAPNACQSGTGRPAEADIEALVKAITDVVMKEVGSK